MTARRVKAPSHAITFSEAMRDPNLLAGGFGDLTSWATWTTVLKAAFGEPLSVEEREVFAKVAGVRSPPDTRVRELWAVVSRRAGKSRVAAAGATYLGAIVDHSHLLSAGEVGTILVLAATQKQAATIKSYVVGFFKSSPILERMIAEDTRDELRLTNGVVIAVHPNNHRSVRGRTLLAVLMDEVSFWRSDESVMPDTETYRAVLPSLATTGGMLIAISSPYRRQGLLHQKHKAHFGVDNPNVLVVQGPTTLFNPTISGEVISTAASEDPEAARAEWFGEFRSDISSFATEVAVRACVDEGVHERAPDRNIHYTAFCDPSGGGPDSMTLGIAHLEGKTAVLDCVREIKPPFNPEAAVAEFAPLLRSYRLASVQGDGYAKDWVVTGFAAKGVHYAKCDKSKSEIYLNALPSINSHAFALLDDERLIGQILGLERRAGRTGRDLVDHAPGGHDDVANAALGALVLAAAGDTLSTYSREEREEMHREQFPHADMTTGADPLANF